MEVLATAQARGKQERARCSPGARRKVYDAQVPEQQRDTNTVVHTMRPQNTILARSFRSVPLRYHMSRTCNWYQ